MGNIFYVKVINLKLDNPLYDNYFYYNGKILNIYQCQKVLQLVDILQEFYDFLQLLCGYWSSITERDIALSLLALIIFWYVALVLTILYLWILHTLDTAMLLIKIWHSFQLIVPMQIHLESPPSYMDGAGQWIRGLIQDWPDTAPFLELPRLYLSDWFRQSGNPQCSSGHSCQTRTITGDIPISGHHFSCWL